MTDQYPHLPGRPTKAKPRVVDGITWVSRHTGVMNYPLFSTDGRATININGFGATYTVYVDGKTIGSRFREVHNAMKAAAKATRANQEPNHDTE